MKTSTLIFLNLLLGAMPALAQAPANANFATDRGQVFTLVLDGRQMMPGNVPQLHLEQLPSGEHAAEFIIPNQRNNATRLRTKIWLEAGQETSFALVTRPGAMPVLRKSGAVALMVSGGESPSAGYDGYPSGITATPPGYGQNMPNNSGYGTIQANPAPGSYKGQYGGNPPPNQGNYAGAVVNGYPMMRPQDVDVLLDAVSKRPFEATKLSTAKEALSQSSIRADDLKRLLRAMGFEASRVELAKFAYPYVIDRQNFYRVYEAFDFDASVQDVQRAIGNVPR